MVKPLVSSVEAAENAELIARDIGWLGAVLRQRIEVQNQTLDSEEPETVPKPPPLPRSAAPYAAMIHDLQLDRYERLVLVLALTPHVAPETIDAFLLENPHTRRRYSEFGGWAGQSHNGFLPTVQTALYLLAGHDICARLRHSPIFAPTHRLLQRGILVLDHRHADEPAVSAALRLSPDYLHRLLTGADDGPVPGPDFPAQRITTPLHWEDLVLDPPTREQIELIGRWIRHADTLLHEWHLQARLKPGYRCLFHGSPGTGKTLTACLLGKRFHMPVYRVDLSQVVSKWIGETEKNLASLFDRALHQNWLLFFDEADSLFGKRTEIRGANDRAANQQIAYLLQRIEDFPGLVILATNQASFMDEAFARRFQSSIAFPMPNAAARLALWRDTFKGKSFVLDPILDFHPIAEKYEVSGGAILNVLRYAALQAVERDPPVITTADILLGLRQEMQKDF